MKINVYRSVARSPQLSTSLTVLALLASCANDPPSPPEDTDASTSDEATSSSSAPRGTGASSTGAQTTGAPVTQPTPSDVASTAPSTQTLPNSTETLPDSTQLGSSTSNAGNTSEPGSSDAGSEDASTQASSSDASGEQTSSDLETTRFVFTVSVGGVVRAFRMQAGVEPEQVADFSVEVTSGDFFLAATEDASRVFVSYNRQVMALEFDPAALAFTELDTATTAGAGTHVEVSPDGEHVLVAHYNEGKATHVSFDGAAFGSPSESSPGSNAHSARVHASGQWAYVPCLGSNHVAQYTLGDTLTANSPATVSVPGGPRHMTFHPNGQFAYVLTELSGQAYAFAVQSNGTLGPEPLDVELVALDVNQPSGSDVQITPDGEHLYTFIRRNQSLYHFDVAVDGTLSPSGEPTNLGQEVRHFAISPTGDVLLAGGSTGVLYTFAVNASTGALTPVGDGVADLQSIQATVIRDVPGLF